MRRFHAIGRKLETRDGRADKGRFVAVGGNEVEWSGLTDVEVLEIFLRLEVDVYVVGACCTGAGEG